MRLILYVIHSELSIPVCFLACNGFGVCYKELCLEVRCRQSNVLLQLEYVKDAETTKCPSVRNPGPPQ